MIIIWKNIKNWEDLYEVNEDGEVRNKLTNHILIGDTNNYGYKRVCLYNKNHNPDKQRFFVHRLVAEHFLTNENNLPEVNHKDMNKTNNNVENLEWVDRLTNERHCRKNSNKPYKPFIVEYNDNKTEIFEVKSELAKKLNVSSVTVKFWLHNENKGYLKYNIRKISYL